MSVVDNIQLPSIDPGQALGHSVFPLALVLSILGWLPAAVTLAATTVALIFYSLQIMEMKRVQKWLQKRRDKKIQALEEKIAKLRISNEPPK